MVEDADSAPGTVVEVLAGLRTTARPQLRPAAVVVSRRGSDASVARDYYDVLGVSRDATADQIQQAYRTLARKYHPDVNKDPAAEDRFKEVNEAYHVLSDPDTRKRYDRFGEDFRQVPEDWEERAGAGGWLRRRRGPPARGCATAVSSAGGDFSEFFEGLFGGMSAAAVADSGRFRAPTRRRCWS